MAEFNAYVPQEDIDKIDNSELVNAIENMRNDFSDQARQDVVNITIFNSRFFVPAHFESSKELVQNEQDRLQFSERPKAKFVLIENPEGEKYIPAFTSSDLLKEFREKEAEGCQSFVMSFADIATVIETFEFISGFVINPFNHNLPFPSDFIAAIKKNLMEQMDMMEEAGIDAKGDDKPDITMTTNS